jgi:ElaB/YqjD/DUF883 family membrane-anchored ribosome-binding protein
MDSTNSAQVQTQLEAIFTEVSDKLESVISDYRTLFIKNQDDALRERIGDFCEELEDLRKKINDTNQDMNVRIDSVGNVAEYMQDLIDDVTDYKKDDDKKTLANEITNAIDGLEAMLHVGGKEKMVIEDTVLTHPETDKENYFTAKHAQLENMVASHPELKNA